jgi:hypothetical protein
LAASLPPPPGLVGWLEMKNMHVCIYSQCVNAFIFTQDMLMCIFGLVIQGVTGFWQAKKNPLLGGFCPTELG